MKRKTDASLGNSGRILIYGDSNTWGDKGSGQGRFAHGEQWPNILQKFLDEDYKIIQEGLCGRIAGDHDRVDLHKNGRVGYEIALRTASPVDYVVIALGANDAKPKYGLMVDQIIDDLVWYEERTINYVRDHPDEMKNFKKVIYLGAANFRSSKKYDVSETFSSELNSRLGSRVDNLVIPDDLENGDDGLHYSKSDHEKVAKMIYEEIKEIEG